MRISDWSSDVCSSDLLPVWRRDVFRAEPSAGPQDGKPEVVLFADTFNTYFEPENARAALRVLEAAGYRVHLPEAANGPRPLCCEIGRASCRERVCQYV